MQLIITTEENLRAIFAEELQKATRQIKLNGLQKPWLTIPEAMEYTGFSRAKLDQLARDGFLTKYYIGGQPVFKLADLDRLPDVQSRKE